MTPTPLDRAIIELSKPTPRQSRVIRMAQQIREQEKGNG